MICLDIQNFLLAFWCWLWRSTIIIVDGTHWSSLIRRSEVQVYACNNLNFYKNHLLLSRWFPNLITHTQQVMSMHYILLWIIVLENELCQKYVAFTIAKSLVWYVLLQLTSSFNPDITGPYSGGKLWNQVGERVCLFKMDGEYVPGHGYRNLMENKIRMEGIYYDERFAQSKSGCNFMCQSLQYHYFAYSDICKWNMSYHVEGRLVMTQKAGKRSMLEISLCKHIQSEVILEQSTKRKNSTGQNMSQSSQTTGRPV